MGIGMPNQIDLRNISTQVYSYVKKAIMSGELKCGERISEQTIAETLGVSRTPVREGLKMLEQYGLIRLKARSYAEVIELDENEIRDLITLRAELEGFSVELFIIKNKHIKEEYLSIKKLAEDCKKTLLTGSISDVFEKDSLFHLEIAIRTRNQFLLEELERLDSKIQLFRISQCIIKDRIAQSIKMHDEILDAIFRPVSYTHL